MPHNANREFPTSRHSPDPRALPTSNPGPKPEQERSVVYQDPIADSQQPHPPQGDYSIARGEVLILTIGSDDRLSYCNAAFMEASGYTHEELFGQPQMLFNRHDMPIEVLRDMRASLDAGSFWSSVIQTRRKSGERYWVHATVAPTSDACQQAGYTVVCIRPRRSQIRSTAAAHETMRRTALRWSQAMGSTAHGVVVSIDHRNAEAIHAGA